MPWTFAHPAAVLPLRRFCPRYLSFPALVVGSTMPDFGYYAPGTDFATHAHSFWGLIEICLPIGILVLLVLCLLRKPLCFLLPQPHRAALAPVADTRITWDISLLLKVMMSLVIGAGTHLVWDAFTHERDLIGLHLTLLQGPAFHLGQTVVPIYYVLQWLSTLLGAAFLLVAYRRWLQGTAAWAMYRDTERQDRWRHRLLRAIAVVALLVAVPLGLNIAAQFSGAFAVAVLLRCIAVFGAMAFVGLVSAAALCCYAQRDQLYRR
jgi:hypothetical protein